MARKSATKKRTNARRNSVSARSTARVSVTAKKNLSKGGNRESSKSAQKSKNGGFPEKFPFWAQIKMKKRRPTLVIDDCKAQDKKKKKEVDGFVHREVIHSNSDGSNVK